MHAPSQMKSTQNNHIKDFPNHLPYLVIFHNDNKHIDDVDHSQNNTPFVEVYICQMKSMQNNHIKDFPNHLPYLVIFHNDNKHIDDIDHSQNNTPFVEVYICQVGFELTTFRTSV